MVDVGEVAFHTFVAHTAFADMRLPAVRACDINTADTAGPSMFTLPIVELGEDSVLDRALVSTGTARLNGNRPYGPFVNRDLSPVVVRPVDI